MAELLVEQCLDIGIREHEFWDMTFAEVYRLIESYNRRMQREAKEKATYDYILAQLIVKGVSLTLGGKGNFPTIQETYPTVFEAEIREQTEKQKEQQMNLSALRFKQFAQSYNKKYKGKEVLKDK